MEVILVCSSVLEKEVDENENIVLVDIHTGYCL